MPRKVRQDCRPQHFHPTAVAVTPMQSSSLAGIGQTDNGPAPLQPMLKGNGWRITSSQSLAALRKPECGSSPVQTSPSSPIWRGVQGAVQAVADEGNVPTPAWGRQSTKDQGKPLLRGWL